MLLISRPMSGQNSLPTFDIVLKPTPIDPRWSAPPTPLTLRGYQMFDMKPAP